MSNKSPCGRWTTIELGPLPIEAIKLYLGISLAPGLVVFYWHAQKHAFEAENKKHREKICYPHYVSAICEPTHVGQQPKYVGKGFDIVRAVSDTGPIVLLGIGMTPKKKGIYSVHSAYLLDSDTLERRIRVKTTYKISI
jgi:hypothetical protein